MAVDDDLNTIVTAVRDCVRTALAATTAGAPARVCEVPGELAWDDCECGVLTVTIGPLSLSTAFPEPSRDLDLASSCAPPYLAVPLTITVLRCAAGPDTAGNPPTCTQLDAAALEWVTDVAATRRAIACCAADLQQAGTIETWVLQETTPLGPQGGCVGSATRLTVGLVNCLCAVG